MDKDQFEMLLIAIMAGGTMADPNVMQEEAGDRFLGVAVSLKKAGIIEHFDPRQYRLSNGASADQA